LRSPFLFTIFSVCLLTVTSLFSAQSLAQDTALHRRLDFIHYLIGREEYKDAIFLLEKEIKEPLQRSHPLSDSIYHLMGWSAYMQKDLTNSSLWFEKVSLQSTSYLKCRLFATYNSIYLGDTLHARELLQGLRPDTGWQTELVAFEKGGLNLLSRDLAAYRRIAASFTHTFYPLVQEERRFDQIATLLEQNKPKSMTLAAMMSAVLPGSGKVYAGKTGEGVSSFLIVTVLGLITWENYRQDGLSDYKTILAGTALGFYYVGNIWGSAFAAQRQNKRYNYEINQRILFDLHIPLRTIFN